jgi:hypothetical protein
MLVAEMCAGWKKTCMLVAEVCAGWKKNLCITLVIYQESLNDARSTKWKNEKKT